MLNNDNEEVVEEHLISIIIPVYNVEDYINRCIESVINQSYKNLEIILVDDGSTDNSGKICDTYKLKDDRIIVLHKNNGGLSDARNKGLDISKGDFIGFVDGDDIIHKDMYKILLDQLLKNNADLSICRYKRFSDEDERAIINETRRNIYNDRLNNVKAKLSNNEYALNKCLSTKIFSVSACIKLYKKELFDEIRFPNYIEMEDWAIIVDLMLMAKQIVLVDEFLYYYYRRTNSIMNGNFKPSDLQLDSVFKRNLNLIDQYFPKLHNQAKTNLTSHYFYIIDKIIKSNVIDKYKNEFYGTLSKLRKEFWFIMIKSKHRFIRKLYYLYLLKKYRFNTMNI